MSIDDVLKPCPFCGGTGNLYCNYSRAYRGYFVSVKCDICGSSGKPYRSSDDPEDSNWSNYACAQACAAWNMRQEEKDK